MCFKQHFVTLEIPGLNSKQLFENGNPIFYLKEENGLNVHCTNCTDENLSILPLEEWLIDTFITSEVITYEELIWKIIITFLDTQHIQSMLWRQYKFLFAMFSNLQGQ